MASSSAAVEPPPKAKLGELTISDMEQLAEDDGSKIDWAEYTTLTKKAKKSTTMPKRRRVHGKSPVIALWTRLDDRSVRLQSFSEKLRDDPGKKPKSRAYSMAHKIFKAESDDHRRFLGGWAVQEFADMQAKAHDTYVE